MRNLAPAAGRLIAAAAALAILLVGSPAFAHTELVASDPHKDSTLNQALSSVTLTFTEPVSQRTTTIKVLGPDGTSFSDGKPRSVNAKVVQQVRPLPLGKINVVWQTVGSDGHTVRGEFMFTNAYIAPTTTPPTVPASTLAQSTPSTSAASPALASTSSEGSGAGWWIFVALVVVIVVGIWLAVGGRRASGRR